MKSTKPLFLSVFALFVWITTSLLNGCASNDEQTSNKNSDSYKKYSNQLVTDRKNKDQFFRTNVDSPLESKDTFTGLSYFVVSPDYRVTARFEPFADKTQKLIVALSDGSEEVYEKQGHAVFKLNGEVCRLLIVKHDDTFSILFKDATSGKQTYGGGRYIDLDPNAFADNQVTIDFNKAYHPYCVYNHTYACPLPPAENTLEVAVEAGEKL